ncbi:hypothetical protein D9M69_318880 [compost metagenome]
MASYQLPPPGCALPRTLARSPFPADLLITGLPLARAPTESQAPPGPRHCLSSGNRPGVVIVLNDLGELGARHLDNIVHLKTFGICNRFFTAKHRPELRRQPTSNSLPPPTSPSGFASALRQT